MLNQSSGDNAVVLDHGEGKLDFPVRRATEGPSAFEIGKLLSSTGLTTYDPGYGNTAPVSSAITYIDGDAGILRYRGYPIDQLAEKSTFLETSYLLIYGELPSQEQLDAFTKKISRHTLLHEDLKAFFNGFPRDAHPMPVLSSPRCRRCRRSTRTRWTRSTKTRSSSRPCVCWRSCPRSRRTRTRSRSGQPFLYPDNSLGLVANFLRMTFGFPAEPYEVDPEFAKALDLLLILHADHEQNCSTSTVRMVGSAQANLFASVSAGINALFGPLHGGANEAVLSMLGRIRDVEDGNVDAFVERVKNKEKGAKLMGFGHRVYKNYDPRAKIVKASADEVLKKLGVHDPLLDIAKALEERALADDYFVERKLYPNVDFYTGVIYRAMGFPTKMFTVLFALGRLPGWISHWREMISDPENRIGRPRQLYVGPTERAYVPIVER